MNPEEERLQSDVLEANAEKRDQKISDEKIVQKIDDQQCETDTEKIKAFREMDVMIKNGTVTDCDAELASYRDEKFDAQDFD